MPSRDSIRCWSAAIGPRASQRWTHRQADSFRPRIFPGDTYSRCLSFRPRERQALKRRGLTDSLPAASPAAMIDWRTESSSAMPNLTLTVNGRTWSGEVPSGASLLDLLREQLQLTGAKLGCGEGQCGS